MSTISAGTTTTTALVQTGDTTGSLVLATGSGATTALTLDSSQNASFAKAVNLPNTFGFKNRIINGGMTIDQRNAGASITQTSSGALYPVDRFAIYGTVSSKFTAQQNAGSVTPPTGFTKYLGITSSATTSLGAGDYYRIYQSIEGLNLSDLAYGTASAKTLTLSFQVYSSLTGTFGGSLFNPNATKSYPFSYTISSANTWTSISVTIAGDTASAIATDNSTGFLITWGLGVGSTYGSGTAGAWASGNIMCPTGSQSVVGTNGATFYITGVQLEVGSQATSFDFRDYGRELILCQRYYELIWQWTGKASSSTTAEGTIGVLITKRTTPTMTVINGTNTFIELGIAVRSFTTVTGGGVNGGYCVLGGLSGLTPPNMCCMYSAAAISASAEL